MYRTYSESNVRGNETESRSHVKRINFASPRVDRGL